MNPFQFTENAKNQLLVNPKATKQEKNDLIFLQFEFEKVYGDKGYFLVPSSGSSKGENDSVKLVALSQAAVLNSAKRINKFFNLTADLNWGLVLPSFHVAGLGVYARAFCSSAAVYQTDWNPQNLQAWIAENKIHLMSLVPTQIFDIVQKQIICPDHMKTVFVGAASLSADLKTKALELKWPIVETYGMSETASMIAVKLIDKLQVLPGVEVVAYKEKLKIKCDSLMTCSIQKKNDQVVMTGLENDWLLTEDRVEIKVGSGATRYLNLLGRDTDFIKINGEGVSLTQLRQLITHTHSITILALPHQRTGFEVVMVCEETVSREHIKNVVRNLNSKVRPFENVKKVYTVEHIPRSELGKIQYKSLEEMIKGNPYEKI